MSYVGHKSLAFRDSGDIPLVIRRRSEGRMKSYPSETDARSWCEDTEDRRQHILDLIRANHEKCALGRYVPIEVLVDTLLANKNADVGLLRQQLREMQQLLDMYSKLNLTEDQKRMLEGMKREMGMTEAGLAGVGGGGAGGTGPGGVRAGGAGGFGTDTAVGAFGGGKGGTGGTAAGKEETGPGGVEWPGTGEKADAKCAALARPECAAEKAGDLDAARLALDKYSPSDLKELVIQKDAELIALKNKLADKQAEIDQQKDIARKAIEQLENLKEIMEERDILRQQLENSVHEIQTLRNRIEDPCVEEIANLEGEIERLRVKGQLSPQEEAEVIRKEVDVLKKYCAKLSKIQEENGRLKTQMERLHELSGIPANYEDVVEDTNDPTELKNRLKDLRRKVANLNEVMDERDKLKVRVKQLEGELLKYGNFPEEIEVFKRKSQLLDDIVNERNTLQERLDKMRGLEEELMDLMKKAARVDELERLLYGERRSSAAQIESLKAQKDEAGRKVSCVKAECDMLRVKAAEAENVEQELECLRYRAKEAEVLRIERDRLKARLDELACIECEFMQLLEKTKCLDTVKAERDMYKAKYEELLGLECECDMLRAQVERFKQAEKERDALLRQVRDCECCIADQEDEIKKLVTHIDRMTQGCNQQQSLNFEELKYLHNKTCQATSNILSKSKTHGGGAAPCPCAPAGVLTQDITLQRADKLFMMRRISSLENDLMRKQRHAQQKVGALQIAIKMERQRLEDLKRLLETEKQRNGELMCKIGAQSRAVASMEAERDLMRKQSSYHEGKLQELLISCEEKKGRVKRLEEELNKARQKQRQDSEALETMRIKLERTINSEMTLQMQLEQHTTGKLTQSPTCPCLNPQSNRDQIVERMGESQTTTFYTELTMQDVKRKRNFVHQCCMKHHEEIERVKRSPSASPKCCQRKDPYTEDVD